MEYRNVVLLRTKFIIFICVIIMALFGYILYRTDRFNETMIIKQAEQQARMLYRQLLLTRQWASDHNGLFVLKQTGVESNPYLDSPTVMDARGHTYYLRNPAMITRELAQYARKDGLGFFRVTSLTPVNPDNGPDAFERQALHAFREGADEFVDIIKTDRGRNVRFIAPLRVIASCLGCHAKHGYQQGDIRGGLSITIPVDWADHLITSNMRSLRLVGFLSILFVGAASFLMYEILIVKRVAHLSRAMERFPERVPEPYRVPSVFKDELDQVTDRFVLFCERLKKSQDDLLKARNQAHLSEKMASLGILTAGIAHEVNNPLSGMLNCVKLLRENPDDRQMVERYLPLLDKGLRQIEMIMRQLLNFGRNEPLQARLTNVAALFGECIELLSYKLKKIELRTHIDITGDYRLDAEALKQIIINVGLNAVQAMDKGGVLTITCQECDGLLVVQCSDTGIGISEENLAHIFDPFFTTKGVGEGTGLGLAVTFSLVERMHGTIAVESSEGRGTQFTIRIPIDDGMETGSFSPER
ncbi:MAG: histidine kinase [Proteobacteria bacterium]|nr:MAG: histidine kinase [Pseudomonadota bacterium]